MTTVTYSGFSPALHQGPEGIAFDHSGNLWVADDSGYVYEFTPTDISTHSGPSVSIQVDSAGAASCPRDNVWGIAFDPSGNLWVSDACSNSIYEYTSLTSSSTPAHTIAFTNVVPRDIAFDSSGNLWVANGTFSSSDGSVLEFASPGSSNAPTITITNAAGGCNGVLQEPFSLAFDSNGNLWVGDYPSTCPSSYIYEYSAPTFTGNPAPTTVITSNNFCEPLGLAFDSFGNLWVADPCNSQVAEFLAPLASGAIGASVIITRADSTGGLLAFPASVLFDSHGNLWVGDEVNGAVYEYAGPPPVSAITPATTVTYSGFSPALHQGPEGIAFDHSGNLWVADDSGYVYEFTSNDISTHSGPSVSIPVDLTGATLCPTGNVWGITFDSTGNLWVSDACSNSIYEYTTPSTNPTLSQTITNSHMVPRDIAFDSNGNLWVANGTFGGSKGSVLEFASPASGPSTPTITITNAANGCNGVLEEPFALTFDSNGNLWVGDFSTNGGICSTSFIYEYSAPTFTGNPAPTTVINGTNFGCPIGLAFDSSSNLWNADPCFAQVEEFPAPLASGLSSPTPSVIINKNDSTGGLLQTPVSVIFGPHGNLWVSDEGNGAVYEYAISGTGTSTSSTTSTTTVTTTLTSSSTIIQTDSTTTTQNSVTTLTKAPSTATTTKAVTSLTTATSTIPTTVTSRTCFDPTVTSTVTTVVPSLTTTTETQTIITTSTNIVTITGTSTHTATITTEVPATTTQIVLSSTTECGTVITTATTTPSPSTTTSSTTPSGVPQFPLAALSPILLIALLLPALLLFGRKFRARSPL